MEYNTIVILVTAIYLAVVGLVIVGFLKQNNKKSVGEVVAISLLLGGYIFIQYIFDFYVESHILALAVMVLIIHIYFGRYKNLYTNSKRFDRYLHLFGSFFYSLFVYSILVKTMNPQVIPQLYESLFVVFLGITLGVLFELFEFMLDLISNESHQKGLKDTNMDLIMNILGALVAGFVHSLLIK